jgi:hypothetical protein
VAEAHQGPQHTHRQATTERRNNRIGNRQARGLSSTWPCRTLAGR